MDNSTKKPKINPNMCVTEQGEQSFEDYFRENEQDFKDYFAKKKELSVKKRYKFSNHKPKQ